MAYDLPRILSSLAFAGVLIFATFASRFGGNGCAEKRFNDRMRAIRLQKLFQIKSAGLEKIITFASRFVRNGALVERPANWKAREKKNDEKIKFILFGSWEKISTFALPTEREGEKRSGGGCHYDYKNKIETDEKQAKTNTT